MSKPTKTSTLTFRVSDDDQEQLRRAAAARDQTVSEYVRSIVRADVAVVSAPLAESNVTGSAISHKRNGHATGAPRRATAWVSNSPAQVVDGETMTSVASLSL